MDLDLRSKPWRKGEERRRKARILKTLILIFCSVRERERERERENPAFRRTKKKLRSFLCYAVYVGIRHQGEANQSLLCGRRSMTKY